MLSNILLAIHILEEMVALSNGGFPLGYGGSKAPSNLGSTTFLNGPYFWTQNQVFKLKTKMHFEWGAIKMRG